MLAMELLTFSLMTRSDWNYKFNLIIKTLQVRQGLKTFSNWPTYPQLYIDGELIGGLDIIKEMLEAGELQTMIPTKVTLEDRLKALTNRSPLIIFMKGDPKVNISHISHSSKDFLSRLPSVGSVGSSWK